MSSQSRTLAGIAEYFSYEHATEEHMEGYLGPLSAAAPPGGNGGVTTVDSIHSEPTRRRPRRRAQRPQPAKRTCPKLIRFTSDELEIVNARAEECHRPVVCYIREASLGITPRARAAHDDLLVRRLATLGNHLRALAHTAAELQLPETSAFDAAVVELLDTIRQLD